MCLQEEIDKTSKEIFADSYPMSIGELMSLYKDDELDIHPEFQRVFRWSLLQKSKLIESILLGIPLPSIFVSQRNDGVWDVIDGVQRLSTIFEFIGIFKDENGNILPASRLLKTKYLPSLEGKVWESDEESNSLTNAQRINFKRSKINIQIIRKESDPNIKFELFQRLNSLGTSLSDQELRNCLLIMLNRDFYYWLKELANYEPFLSSLCLTDRVLEEQYNLELALRFIIFKNVTEEELKDIKGLTYLGEFLTDKMIQYAKSEVFNKENEARVFKNTFDFINNTLGENAFKRYNTERNKFEGKFLLSSFEAVGIGIGSNIENWISKTVDTKLIEDLTARANSLWSDNTYLRNIGSGVHFNVRILAIVPLGKKIFRP